MIIRIKGITHERMSDAPFVGALISAIDCKFNCINCFNQDIKNLPTLEIEDTEIIRQIKSNPFNQGIIFAGLEWSLQPQELNQLVKLALENNLKVIIYTGLTEDKFKELFYDIYNTEGIYIKCGRYIEELKTNDNIQYGIKLATSNQYIYKKELIINDNLLSAFQTNTQPPKPNMFNVV